MAIFSIKLLTQNTKMISRNLGNRPRNWARYIDGNFDIACLQEAFTNSAVDGVVDRLSPRPQVHHRNNRYRITSSGLANLVFQGEITGQEWSRYARQAGWDRWAKKGAIMSVVHFGEGLGSLQVYNTHLNAARKKEDLSYQENRLVTIRQCFELARFIVKTRREDLPAIVCGDFNLDGENDSGFAIAHIVLGGRRRGLSDVFWNRFENDAGEAVYRSLSREVPRDFATTGTFGPSVSTKTQYQILVDMFRVLGFEDAWGQENRNRCFTTKLGRRDDEDEYPDRRDFMLRMPIIATPHPSDFLAAQDSPMIAPGGKRLDYVFFAPGNGEGPTTMQVASTKRTYIPTPGQDRSLSATELSWMSDHVGLICRLVFS